MEQKSFLEMVDRYLAGTASPQERQLLEEYYRRLESQHQINITGMEEAQIREELFARLEQQTRHSEAPVVPIRRPWIKRIAAVAAAAAVIAAAAWWIMDNRTTNHTVAVEKQSGVPALLSPGRDAAILTLSDGKQVRLDSATGTIRKEDGTTIVNLKGQLSYAGASGTNSVEFHTISTARGNQYQLVLADGSHVYLNSASSLHFPSAFNGNTREVELLSGEAYFDITTNPDQPFHVKTREMDIQVTGTHFNVNAYNDEGPVATTLVSGKINVSAGAVSARVVPGQQAVLSGNQFVLTMPDINKVIAWRSGFFDFDQLDIQSIMRQISRWYDVDVQYEGRITSEKFGGRFNKQLPLVQLLKLLEANDVHFDVKGKKVIVKS